MVEQATTNEWDETLDLISNLWPAFGDKTPLQAIEWQARLRSRNQFLVRAACRNVFAAKSSKQPGLPWILAELRDLEQRHGESSLAKKKAEKISQEEEWEEIKAEADLLRLILAALPKTELVKHKLQAIKCLAVSRGFITPPGDITAKANYIAFVNGVDRDLTDDPEQWNPIMVNLVHVAKKNAEHGLVVFR